MTAQKGFSTTSQRKRVRSDRCQYVGNSPTNGYDPTGLYFETWWDAASVGVGIASVGADIANIWKTGEGWGDLGLDLLGLTADIALTAIPVAPGGVSFWLSGRKATRLGIQAADGAANAYQSFTSYQAAQRAAERGDNWGVGLNLLGAGLGFSGAVARSGQGLNEFGLEFYLRRPRLGTLHSEFLPSPMGLRRRHRSGIRFTGTAKQARWAEPVINERGPGIRDHFGKHGDQIGASNLREYDISARLTIQNGRRFSYRDPTTNDPRIGYWNSATGLFTATSQTRRQPVILTHFPLSWQKIRKFPGFSVQ